MSVPTAPSPEAKAAVYALRLDLIFETMELTESYAISGREAAWRGDINELGLQVRRLRECTRTLIETLNQLTGDG